MKTLVLQFKTGGFTAIFFSAFLCCSSTNENIAAFSEEIETIDITH
ncbi:hypothetical protein ACFO5O_09800 [Geojedonia litorea]|uniref:Lipoprotein n=1 Tax=Geojedonia litorea TaxID=1268269 RepID=A0ABV9N6P8_9FLAO